MTLLQDILEFGVIPALDIPGLLIFRQVNNEFNKICNKQISKILFANMNRKMMDAVGDNVMELKEMLELTGSFVIGSFLVQCLLGENWEAHYKKPMNMDIYVIGPNATFGNFMDNVQVIDTKMNDIGAIKIARNVKGKCVNLDKMYRCDYKGKIVNIRINHILRNLSVDGYDCNYDAYFEYISRAFDWNICKNMYFVHNGVAHIRVASLGIFDKVMKYEPVYVKENEIKLFNGKLQQKYIDRGFTLIK